MNERSNKTIKIDIDSVIERLLSVRNAKPGKTVNLNIDEIFAICYKAREIFSEQPMFLELGAPLKICGTSFSDQRRHSWTILRPFKDF